MSIPLVVDLDETLIRTDILWESIIRLWRTPVGAIRAFYALLLHGKAAFKAALANAVKIDPVALPYRKDVLEFVTAQRKLGREIVLATATHRIVAQSVADHLQLFSKMFATEGKVNLSGAQKRSALESAYGPRGFDYIGDSRKDLPIFSAARSAYLVDPSRSLLQEAAASGNVARVFSEGHLPVKLGARALRLHQWSKNVLLLVPMLAAHRVLEVDAWLSVILAFLGFSLVASATYLLNDLVDLQSDRLHPKKRFRPLASGYLSIRSGLLLALAVGIAGFVISYVLLPTSFFTYLVAYLVLTITYSLDLKRRLLWDVMALSILYTLRILAGGAAVGVVVSEWLLMFSLFIFISLAFLKRVIEIPNDESSKKVPGRGYFSRDAETVRVAGLSAGLLSVLVLALYISSPSVIDLYQAPQVLWLICPLLIYWITRIWFLAGRGHVDHDPVVFALLDWRSYVLGLCGLGIIILAKIGPSSIHW